MTPAEAAAELTLPDYHARHVAGGRAECAAGKTAKATADREALAVRCYAEWDRRQRPGEWPAELSWAGVPLKYVMGRWLESFLLESARSLATASVLSTWQSLRVILSDARKRNVIPQTPTIPRLKRSLQEAVGEEEDDEQDVLAYTDAELGRIYAAFADHPHELAMQTAQVLGTNAGPRPVDLFLLRFEEHVHLRNAPPLLVFRTRKTGKKHRVPLAAVTVERLARLRNRGRFQRVDTWLFPDPTSPKARDPERSRSARRRTAALRDALEAAGLDAMLFRTPWHSVCKSCTTRFNAHGIAHGLGSVGRLITHDKDADVSSQSYDITLPTLLKAVETIGWPFWIYAGTRFRYCSLVG